jgi:hypothetical protein
MYYYTEPGEAAVAKAFIKCIGLMQSNSYTQMAVVVPDITNLHGIISDQIGDKGVDALIKNKVIKQNTESIHLFTRKDSPRSFKGVMLLAITRIDQTDAVILACPDADIVFVPLAVDDMDEFVRKYNPTLF